MAVRLDESEVRRWLRGQKAAEAVIECERARALLQRTPEESMRIYLDLKASAPPEPNPGPSPMLMAVRQVLDRYAAEIGQRK